MDILGRHNEMSAGQQQLVAVAKAVVSKPSTFFADKPTGNSDSRFGGEVTNILQQFGGAGVYCGFATDLEFFTLLGGILYAKSNAHRVPMFFHSVCW
jgi:hypothetical protein